MSPIRVALVCPIVTRYDGISAAARDSYVALATDPRFDPIVLTWRNDFPDVRAQLIAGVGSLLLDPSFLGADVILYHFGIYAEFFDAMLIGNGRARQAVTFHNVTPARFATSDQRATIERSMRQISNFRQVDEIWCVSAVNATELLDRGFDPELLSVFPLAVERPELKDIVSKRRGTIEILFVGRFVRSKGVLDLIRALKQRRIARTPIRLRLAGNEAFSDIQYIREVRSEIASSGLAIEMVGTVEDADLASLYHTSHILAIPSYHEGFCIPVIEALRGGCVPVGYDSYNLPNVIGGLGRLVPAGDVDALSAALNGVIEDLALAFADETRNGSCLSLDGGTMTLETFDRRAKQFVRGFSFAQYADTTRRRVIALTGDECPYAGPRGLPKRSRQPIT